MTKEEKELLLYDLSARLPYGCIYKASKKGTIWFKLKLRLETIDRLTNDYYDEITPYLRPMSSMTEEEKEVCRWYKHDIMTQGYGVIEIYVTRYTNWLDKRHFDWRRTDNNETMIEAGLAIEAPEGMYNI